MHGLAFKMTGESNSFGGARPDELPLVLPLSTRFPTLGVDAASRVAHANAAARTMLRARDVLAVQEGRLVARTAAATLTLRDAIRRVVEGAQTTLPLSLPSEGGETVPVLVAAALDRPTDDMPGFAWVHAMAPAFRDAGPGSGMLAAWFGLTPAEAEVARRAARGEGLRAIAGALGIQHSTARSHLNRVFQKAGVRRQAELAWLVAHLPG